MATKIALCIGINDYPGVDSDLAGCVNDANDWGEVLRARGFSVDVLLDAAATRAAMSEAMAKVVSRLAPGDVGVIQYSGHGTWQADDDGDEPDQRDEALCPYDLTTVGPLLDDDLFEILSQHDPQARLVFVSDSCHSGSVSRSAAPLTTHAGRRRFAPPALFLDDTGVARARAARHIPARGLSRGTALLMSGCTDIQTSADAWFGNRPNGAFSRVALDTLSALPAGATYQDWHTAISGRLPSPDYEQEPQLFGSAEQKAWPVLA